MNELNNGINGANSDSNSHSRSDLHIDLLIDKVVTRRAAGNAGRHADSRLSPAEALIIDLARLDAIEWPADEAGDRIMASVTTAAAAPATPHARRHRAQRRHRQSARSRWLAAGAIAAAAALVAAGFQLLAAQHEGRQPVAESGAKGHQRTGQKPGGPKTPSTGPASLTAMVVVSRAGALRAVGAVSSGAAFLTCVTRSICYIEAQPGAGNRVDIARSVNGGATWTAGAALPPLTFEWNAGITCPRPEQCFAPFGPLGMLATTDGFAHVQPRPVTMPAGESGQVNWLSCPTTKYCVAEVTLSDGSPAFIYSDDGGSSWAAGRAPAFGADGRVVQLRCDRDGACIAAVVGGIASHPIQRKDAVIPEDLASHRHRRQLPDGPRLFR